MLDVLAGGGQAAVQLLRLCLHFLAVAEAFGKLVWQGAQAAVVGFGGGKRVLVGLILLLQGLQRGFGFGLLALGKLVLLGALGEGVFANRMSATATSGSSTTGACTTRGWTGRPRIVSNMAQA